jgi:serine/threonine protein kinase
LYPGGVSAGLELKIDVVVGDRYRLRRPLGEGGMARVWEASHVYTQKRVALKFLKGERNEDKKRFLREARAAASIRHPNVIDVHDFVELPGGMLVMAMDLLEGQTLGAFLAHEKKLPLATVAAVGLRVIDALGAAHAAGIVHRDLKPENVFLSRAVDASVVVKVLDFGIAKLTAAEGLAARTQALTDSGSMVGTPYYMSPEQVVSEKDLDARADIWSLGVVLYECLAGVRPTEAENVGRVLKMILMAELTPIGDRCPDLPEDVAALIMRMLERDRDQRIRNLGDVRDVLERYASPSIEMPARSAGPPPDEPCGVAASGRIDTNDAVSVALSRSPRGRKRVLAGGGVALLAVAGVAGAMKMRYVEISRGSVASHGEPTSAMAADAAPPSIDAAAAPATSESASAPMPTPRSAEPPPRAARPPSAVIARTAAAPPSIEPMRDPAPPASSRPAPFKLPPGFAESPKD